MSIEKKEYYRLEGKAGSATVCLYVRNDSGTATVSTSDMFHDAFRISYGLIPDLIEVLQKIRASA